MTEHFTQLDDWLNWLEAKAIAQKKYILSLDHMLPIAQQLQVTDFDIPVVLVSGTNGKGSSVAMLESIYLAAGCHTAAYTSPHFIHFTERLRINNRELSEQSWLEAFIVVEQVRGEVELSYFEFSVLAGLWLMKQMQAQLDVILLEVGLGGRLDAMNVVNADVAVITTIDFDHMEYLGDTREAIAHEKAGIMRLGKPVVCGDFNPPQSLFDRAKELQAPISCQNKDFFYGVLDNEWCWQNQAMSLTQLPTLALPIQNASTVLQVIYLLNERLPVEAEAIKQGLASAKVTGRMQRIGDKPEVILDVAHNPHAARYLAEQLPRQRRNTGRVLAVIGMKADKDIAQTLAAMKPLVDHWYVASLQGYRAATADTLLACLADSQASGFDTVAEAYFQALTAASDSDTIVVFGSFFTVAPVLEIVNERASTITWATA